MREESRELECHTGTFGYGYNVRHGAIFKSQGGPERHPGIESKFYFLHECREFNYFILV